MNKRFILTAGGSGGHIFPAEALAKELISLNNHVDFVTDKRASAFNAHFPHSKEYRICATGYAGKNLITKVWSLFVLGFGVLQSLWILYKNRPDAVVGFGGYGAFPACFAAIMLRIPLIIHEQNAVLGSANRILAPKSKLITLSFPETSCVPSGVKTICTGLPVRPQFIALRDKEYPPIKDQFTILVFGGSQGAKILSRVIPETLHSLPDSFKRKLKVWQQCRAEDLPLVSQTYTDSGINVELSTFFDNIPSRLEQALLVICRAGASTIAELSASGRPSIMVPIANSHDGHQIANAKSLENVGGTFVCLEKDFDQEWLSFKIQELFNNPKMLVKAATNAKNWGKINASSLLANAVLETIGDTHNA